MPTRSDQFISLQDYFQDYLEPHEVDKRRDETNTRNPSHNRYVPKGVFVESEPGWFGEKHGANKRPLSRIEAGSDNNG